LARQVPGAFDPPRRFNQATINAMIEGPAPRNQRPPVPVGSEIVDDLQGGPYSAAGREILPTWSVTPDGRPGEVIDEAAGFTRLRFEKEHLISITEKPHEVLAHIGVGAARSRKVMRGDEADEE